MTIVNWPLMYALGFLLAFVLSIAAYFTWHFREYIFDKDED